MEANDGVLYSAALRGGLFGFGAVFKIKKDGTAYRILHHFGSSPGDGQGPTGGLVEGSDKLLYGTTSAGGTYGHGTVFKLAPDGSNYSILYSFAGPSDGVAPAAALIEGSDGALYGTTQQGNATYGGTVFKLDKLVAASSSCIASAS